MTILFGGGEMGAFIPSDGNARETTSQAVMWNSSFSRAALNADATNSYNESAEFTGQDDFYTHACMGNDGFPSGTVTNMAWVSDAGVEAVRFRYDRGTGTVEVDYHNGSAYVSAGTISSNFSDARHDVDVHIVCNSGSGSIGVWLAGTPRLTATGLNLASTAAIEKLRVYGANFPPIVSQVIVADVPTIGWRLLTRHPNGAGSDSAWTGSFAGIDEAVYSDADFINSATAAQVSMFTQTGPAISGYVPKAVIVTARAKRGAAGPQNLQLALRSAGTNYFSASKALDVGYGAFVEVWETDPATSADWQNTAIDSLQIGVKSIA